MGWGRQGHSNVCLLGSLQHGGRGGEGLVAGLAHVEFLLVALLFLGEDLASDEGSFGEVLFYFLFNCRLHLFGRPGVGLKPVNQDQVPLQNPEAVAPPLRYDVADELPVLHLLKRCLHLTLIYPLELSEYQRILPNPPLFHLIEEHRLRMLPVTLQTTRHLHLRIFGA